MAFKLPKLPYDYNALMPHIDKRTMTIHHGKHHNGYTNKLNAAIKGTPLEKKKIEEILKKASKHGAAVRNNGGGYYNHSLFWKVMSPKGGGQPSANSKLGKAINKLINLKMHFQQQLKLVLDQVGHGYVLVVEENYL